ncbi:MAG: ABC transporter ATP-binding protein [Candidatus Thorarchaeota archaeon]
MTKDSICIQSSSLTKKFGELKAVDSLDLNVGIGTRFALLGPNGAGKTTTVRMLSGLMTPSSGNASVCGFDISRDRDAVKAVTGLLPESPGLYSKLSAVEFLEFIGALNGLTRTQLDHRIGRLLSIMGLESRQDDLLEGYSSGMKQKVLVASTVLHEPQLVFLDEPTSRLDPAASALVKDLIKALSDETNTTFFICTHMTSFAEELCDVVGILNDGRLVTVGSPQNIMTDSKADSLENAYLKIVGGKIDRDSLLTWR